MKIYLASVSKFWLFTSEIILSFQEFHLKIQNSVGPYGINWMIDLKVKCVIHSLKSNEFRYEDFINLKM